MRNQAEKLTGIYGITDDLLTPGPVLLDKVQAALAGGISLLQYRSKTSDRRAQQQQLEQLLHLCRSGGVPLIINDDVHLCHATGADGVHLGKSDSSIGAARAILGEAAIIGVTCHDDIQRALDAEQAGADYVAFGRFFPSQTKPEASPADIALLAEASEQLTVPVVAIGGINAENGASLISQGADMLAVIHSLFAGDDVKQNAQQLVNLFEE